MVQHFRDLSGMTVASLVATLADGVVFGALVHTSSAPLAFAAVLGAIVGAVLHFSICRVVVFSRFRRRLLASLPRYAVMSGTALMLHAPLTTYLAFWVGPDAAWLLSKVSVFALWCYPASRYLVFGTLAPMIAKGDQREAIGPPKSAPSFGAVDGRDTRLVNG